MRVLKILLISSVLCLGIGGGFAPWVFRAPAALQLTAPGLAEYVKFLAEKRLGLLEIQRLYYLLPLAVAALGLPLLTVNARLKLHRMLNGLLRLCVLPMALALLSPVWSPGVLMNAEFRLQTIVGGIAVGLAIIAPIFKHLPLKWLVTAIALAAAVSVGLALRQFTLTTEAIAATYNSPVVLGWGGWVTATGAAGLLISAVWAWVIPVESGTSKSTLR